MNTDLKTILVVDPVVDVEESYRASEAVIKGGVNKSIYLYTADSSSDQNWIFNNITPPSLNTVVKRDLRVKFSILVANVFPTGAENANFNAITPAGVPVPLTQTPFFNVVPRACMVGSSASAIELRLNGSATSTSINDYACIYPHITRNEDIARFSSEMPFQKDNLAVYQGAQPYSVPIAGGASVSDARSPFAAYGTNPLIPTRGSFVWTQLVNAQVIAGTANSVSVYQLNVTEQLMISPIVWGELMDKCAGLTNINNLILNIRFADVNRMVSSQNPNNDNFLYVTTQSSVTIPQGGTFAAGSNYQTPTLLVEYITQDPILAAKAPATVVYDYSLLQPFISTAGTWLNTTVDNAQFTAQSLRLASIPSRLYIFARPSKSALSTPVLAQMTPDTFLRIKNLKINFNNRINLFATYDESDLYNMSVKNGLQDSFNDWKFQSGSVCIVDIAKDIGLDASETTGQANVYSTLQVSATLSASPIAYAGLATGLQYDFYILVEQPGKAFISASECQFILTGPSASTVLELTSNLDNKVDAFDLEGKGVGGSFMGSVGRLFKSGLDAVKNVNPESVSKGVQMAQSALSSLGLGVAGGKMKGKHSRVY
jgi:hypothetical protein